MAVVFHAATDESGDGQGFSYRAGFLAPVLHWTTFSTAWDREVLSTAPAIPYLHMTELLDPEWQLRHGLGPKDAEEKQDRAFRVISRFPSLIPIGIRIDARHFREVTKLIKVKTGPLAKAYKFDPDYVNFLAFANAALVFAERKCRNCEKVDFLVERNGEITKRIGDFYNGMPDSLNDIGNSRLARLIGDLIEGGKDRAPLQAADMLCWYEQRRDSVTWTTQQKKNFRTVAKRPGIRFEWTREEMDGFAQRAHSHMLRSPASYGAASA